MMSRIMVMVIAKRPARKTIRIKTLESCLNIGGLDQQERIGGHAGNGLFDLNMWWNLNILRGVLTKTGEL